MAGCRCGLRQDGSFLVDAGCARHGRPEGERMRTYFGFPPTVKGRKDWDEQRSELEEKLRQSKEKQMF